VTGLRIGVRIPSCAPVNEIAEVVRHAEDLGIEELWFPDSQLLWRDVFSVLTAAALSTERIRLGTAVTNLATRHPSVVASAARTIAELAPGRLTLGIGVGDSSVGPIGLKPTTRARLTEGLAQLRALLGGEEWDYGTVSSRLRDPASVPLHLAASGPRNLRLAGEIADGVILLSGISVDTLASSTAQVRAGALAAGRDPESIPMTVSAFCHVTDDVPRAARMLKPICASIARNGGGPFLKLAGIELEVPDRFEGVYPDMLHAEDWDQAVKVAGQWVSDDDALRFAQAFCLFGTAEEIAVKLRAAHAAGATSVFLQHVGSYDLPLELIEAVGGQVLPALAAS